jgi:hypothetical protein
MKRVFIAAVSCAALLACAHRPASAMVELCPATLNFGHVGTAMPASLYGFDLTALGPRSIVSARLALDTNLGWYVVDVPAVALSQKNRRYHGPSSNYTRHDWVSPVMYARFPRPAAIAHAWVYRIAVKDDAMFGWSEQGSVLCPPPASARQAEAYAAGPEQTGLDPQDQDALTAPPPKAAAVMDAVLSSPLASSACPVPFRDAGVTNQARPDMAAMDPDRPIVSTIAVALAPDGSLQDASLWGPSGISAFDASALDAARRSHYSGAIAYCQPVPSMNFFKMALGGD